MKIGTSDSEKEGEKMQCIEQNKLILNNYLGVRFVSIFMYKKIITLIDKINGRKTKMETLGRNRPNSKRRKENLE
jgi:hypothetical protein